MVLISGGMSMITPPVAMAAYAAAHIAQADPMRVGWTACRLAWPVFVLPFVFVWSPALLFYGEPATVVISILTTTGGVWLGSAAISGFLVQQLSGATRVAAAVAAFLMILPDNAFPGAVWFELAGVVGGGLLVASETRRGVRRKALKVG